MTTGLALTSRASMLFADHSASNEKKILALGLVKHCQNFIICSRTFLSTGSPGQIQAAMRCWQCLTKSEADEETQQTLPYLRNLWEEGGQTNPF